MPIFLELLIKLVPLYGLIILGYMAGKRLNAQKETIALLLIYVITPVVVFDGAFRAQLDTGVLLLPLGVYVICCLFSAISYWIGSKIWTDSTRNIFAYSAGSGNTGYFGLPVALMLFGDAVFAPYVMAMLGMTLFFQQLSQNSFVMVFAHRDGVIQLAKKATSLFDYCI